MAKLAYSQEELRDACAQVDKAFDIKVLQQRCQQSKKSLFHASGGKLYGTKAERFAFRNSNARILTVAHLDTVQQDNAFGMVQYHDETLIFSPKLDDRLGAYTILDLLPALGIQADLLFTDNEECGATTAAKFKTDKKYNWIVSFDRRGEDVVTYQYTWDAVLRDYFTVGHGSFSCIGKLDSLGCQAVNIGVGYQNEHSQRALFVYEEYVRQVARFLLFYQRYQATRFPYEKREITKLWGHGNYTTKCEICQCVRFGAATAYTKVASDYKEVAVCYRCFHKSIQCIYCEDHWMPAHITGRICVECLALNLAAPTQRAPSVSIGDKPKEPIVRRPATELMAEMPEAIAFCEDCYEPRTMSQIGAISDAVMGYAMCGKCGSLMELVRKSIAGTGFVGGE